MERISMRNVRKSTVEEYFNLSLSSAAAKGVKDKTLETYKHRFRSIAKRLNVAVPMRRLTSQDLKNMILSMREEGLSASSINSYTRTLKVFFSWCNKEGHTSLNIKLYKAPETVKEVYMDEELLILIRVYQFCFAAKTQNPAEELFSDFHLCGDAEVGIVHSGVLNILCSKVVNNCIQERIDKADLHEPPLAAKHGEYLLGVCSQVDLLELIITVSWLISETNVLHAVDTISSHFLRVDNLDLSVGNFFVPHAMLPVVLRHWSSEGSNAEIKLRRQAQSDMNFAPHDYVRHNIDSNYLASMLWRRWDIPGVHYDIENQQLTPPEETIIIFTGRRGISVIIDSHAHYKADDCFHQGMD